MKDTEARIEVLQQQHRLLDEKIKIMYQRYAQDSDVEELKIKKLQIKDNIARLQKELDNA